ncbi:MAG: methyltransferase domain-containing protein [Deltaproteobacteria bacterium]|nr:methyltransferase domain-containing protein [Deltaproteobacteria bacterium]
MAKTGPFDEHREQYDRWFEEHADLYEAELAAVNALLPASRHGGLEIGVGTGKFAARLGVQTGIEPSAAMAERAAERGIEVRPGVAEALPFDDRTFEYVLMVTTICYVDDPERAFAEAFRVLRPGGCIVIGFVDPDSALGRWYVARRSDSVFYRDARFFANEEVLALLARAGFVDPVAKQTLLLGQPASVVRDGYGTGAFVVLRGHKPSLTTSGQT